jgi:hypothetical protein
MLTQLQAIELFSYADGVLCHKNTGKRAGWVTKQGYVRVGFSRRSMLAHRIIYLMHHGYAPEFVDHVDGNKQNNKVENLRAATRAQNQLNARLRVDSVTKLKNVTKHRNKWQVRMRIAGVLTHIGTFEDIELAAFVASEYRDKYHGEFANHG